MELVVGFLLEVQLDQVGTEGIRLGIPQKKAGKGTVTPSDQYQ